jgi:hypothetical protein
MCISQGNLILITVFSTFKKKTQQNLHFTKIQKFPKISKNFQKFPKISKNFQKTLARNFHVTGRHGNSSLYNYVVTQIYYHIFRFEF